MMAYKRLWKNIIIILFYSSIDGRRDVTVRWGPEEGRDSNKEQQEAVSDDHPIEAGQGDGREDKEGDGGRIREEKLKQYG